MRPMAYRTTVFGSLAALLAGALLALAPLPAGPAAAEGDPGASLAGRLLVARAELQDPNFRQSVILMLEHSSDGAMGLVINRRLGTTSAAELLGQMGMAGKDLDAPIAVYFGGPVEPGRGVLLHSDDQLLETSEGLPGGFALSADPEMLRRIARGEGPKASRFLLGYAGWGPGQLEAEIARGTWWDVEADPALVFEADIASIWQRAIDLRGLDL